MQLDQAIKAIRVAKKLSLNTAATRSDMSKSQYLRFENGTNLPMFETLERLSVGLDAPMWQILWLVEEGKEGRLLDWEREIILKVYPELETYLQYTKLQLEFDLKEATE